MVDALGLSLIVAAITLIWFKVSRDDLKHIPGPRRWPLVGNALQIRTPRQFLLFWEWSKSYGHIFSLSLFGSPVVVLNSFESIYEALVTKGQEFAGRPHSYRINYLKNNSAIGFIDPSPKRQKLRKIASSSVKAYGPGLGRIERLSQEITEDFIREFSKGTTDAIDIKPIIYNAVGKMMCLILVGEKFDDSSKVYSSIREVLDRTNTLLVPSPENQRIDNFPWLRFVGNKVFEKMKEVKDIQNEMFPVLKKLCLTVYSDEHGAVPVGRALFNAQETLKDDVTITETDVQPTMLELLMAGITTTTNTFYSLINILIHHPQIQDKLFKEIDNHLGQRQVCLSDKEKMPYTWATVYECLRYASNVANDIPHKALKDTELCGVLIPKDTQVYLNLFAVHHDPEFWGDPEDFRPERFLDEDGNFVGPQDPRRRHVLAFGAGPRVCIGENLAKARLFIWLASVMQRFEVKADPHSKMAPIDPRTYEPGIVLLTQPYKTLFVQR